MDTDYVIYTVSIPFSYYFYLYTQAGAFEVLGAHYGGEVKMEAVRRIQPAIINCRGENFFKAQQYGRWIVLNKKKPTRALGEQVGKIAVQTDRNN